MQKKGMELEGLVKSGDVVLAGVSGGADSVCLLLMLLEYRKHCDFFLEAVHVEHGIRGDASRRDAAFVKRLCEKRGVCCRIYPVDVPAYAKGHGLGVEEAARKLRYECFREAAEDYDGRPVKIALAHHADDNAETMLFRLIRGSGIHGLYGMRPARRLAEGVTVIRPLLGMERAEIEAYLKAQGQPYCRDATNEDTDYSRNRIRHKVMPELKAVNTGAVHHMMQSAQMLRELSDYLEEETRRATERVCRDTPDACVIDAVLFSEYPALLIREVLLVTLQKVAGSSRDIGSVHVEELCTLYTRQVGRVICLPYGVRAERVYEGIRLYREEPAADMERESIEVTGEMLSRAEKEEVVLALPDGRLHLRIRDFSGNMQEIPKKTYTKWFDYGKIKSGLRLRRERERRLPEDRCCRTYQEAEGIFCQ